MVYQRPGELDMIYVVSLCGIVLLKFAVKRTLGGLANGKRTDVI